MRLLHQLWRWLWSSSEGAAKIVDEESVYAPVPGPDISVLAHDLLVLEEKMKAMYIVNRATMAPSQRAILESRLCQAVQLRVTVATLIQEHDNG